MNHTKFCCCSANHCNVNFTDAYVPTLTDDETAITVNSPLPKVNSSLNPAVIAAIAAIFACFVGAVGTTMYVYWRKRKNYKKGDAERGGHHGNHDQSMPSPQYSLEKLKLIEVIGMLSCTQYYIYIVPSSFDLFSL